ncbi:hypothetical protein MBRA1_003644 [Malassezia brasiliensis]|uniref:Uncharacterized protein n=1 Tax=Malassezia brasiliensis TaxID=1821822 RepID=A0AAF0IUI3_9BASI|nr:hypothetical protein MBRA1_003644 [Malassezia brasiliensis]
MSDNTPGEKRSDVGSVAHTETMGAGDPLLQEPHVVLTELPQGFTATLLDTTLLLSTIHGKRLGFIGNGRKAGAFHLFKKRPLEFDIMDAEGRPRYRIRRMPNERHTDAQVYERRTGPNGPAWHQIGQIVVRSRSPRGFGYEVSYTLYEIHADGLYYEPFATTESNPFTHKFRFLQDARVVANMQQVDWAYVRMADGSDLGVKSKLANYLFWLEPGAAPNAVQLATRCKQGRPITTDVALPPNYIPSVDASAPPLTTNQRMLYLAAAYLVVYDQKLDERLSNHHASALISSKSAHPASSNVCRMSGTMPAETRAADAPAAPLASFEGAKRMLSDTDLVLSEIPLDPQATQPVPSLLITTVQGERVGSIGKAHKSAQFQLFKQRPWEFDVLDGNDQPLYQIRRLSAGRFASADVLERRDNQWHKIGRVAVEAPSARRETSDATYTLYDKHADGQPERAIATARRARKNRFLFHQHDMVVAGVQEIDKARYGFPNHTTHYVVSLQSSPVPKFLEVPVLYQGGHAVTNSLTFPSELAPVVDPGAPASDTYERLLYLAGSFLIYFDYYDADRSASPRARRGSMGEHASILVSN